MSVGAARCFFPNGVGQLLNMTSSIILQNTKLLFYPFSVTKHSLPILQPAGVVTDVTTFPCDLKLVQSITFKSNTGAG